MSLNCSRSSRRVAALALLVLACTPTSPASDSTPKPSAVAEIEVDPRVAGLEDPGTRRDTIAQLQRDAAAIAKSGDDVRGAEFAELLFPILAKIYAEDESSRDAILAIAGQIARPEAEGIWALAVRVDPTGIDGSVAGHRRAIAAMESIRATRAAGHFELTAMGKDITTALSALLAAPQRDMVMDDEGRLRYELAKTLGVLEAAAGVGTLIAAVESDALDQPKGVYKAAIDALGQIGDPSAVDALIAVQFRIPDAPGTQSIYERSVQALAAIGEPAVPALIDTLEGNNRRVNKLAAQVGLDNQRVKDTAMRTLAVIGSPTAVDALLVALPQRDCDADPRKLEDFDQGEAISTRAFVAHALGFIGDRRAVEPLCRCRNASRSPFDLAEISAALGRIGGDEAFACLADIVVNGSYDPEEVHRAFEHEIRWEGARHLILAASPAQSAEAGRVLATASANAKVATEIEGRGLAGGLAVLESCQEDVSCHEQVLLDATRPWFEREVAAFNFARLSTPGDIVAAAKLARAFKTRDPEARVNIAWLTGKLAGGQGCPECVEALEGIMKAEELSKDTRMQPAWLVARHTIAKLSHGPR